MQLKPYMPVAGLATVRPVVLSDEQRQAVFMAASVLLDYPTDERFSTFSVVRQGLAEAKLPGRIQQEFDGFYTRIKELPHQELETHYVDIFDMKRKSTMYLSYYLTGDTRKRGVSLLVFREAYERAGFEMKTSELPDYLPVVLEFAALGDAKVGGELLAAHRDAVEVLRTALDGFDSPYAYLAAAVCMAMPRISRAEKERIVRLITQGPPTELVGTQTTAMSPFTLSPEPHDQGASYERA